MSGFVRIAEGGVDVIIQVRVERIATGAPCHVMNGSRFLRAQWGLLRKLAESGIRVSAKELAAVEDLARTLELYEVVA